jgi:hypothetical protein
MRCAPWDSRWQCRASIKMSLINYNATRAVGLPLAMPSKIKTFLKTTDATPSAFAMRFTVTSRLFTLMKQKGIFVYPFNQISNFS